jgi:hypothetical protein
VLAVHHVPTGKWGALGISRRSNLMFKPLGAGSLADLMADFKVCMRACNDWVKPGLLEVERRCMYSCGRCAARLATSQLSVFHGLGSNDHCVTEVVAMMGVAEEVGQVLQQNCCQSHRPSAGCPATGGCRAASTQVQDNTSALLVGFCTCLVLAMPVMLCTHHGPVHGDGAAKGHACL